MKNCLFSKINEKDVHGVIGRAKVQVKSFIKKTAKMEQR